MTRTVRLTQAVGVVILALALLALAVQLVGGVMWQELADQWVRLRIS